MIRDAKFLMSKRLYAVAPDSLTLAAKTYHVSVRAVWFRRKNGVTAACIGQLWDFQRPAPVDAAEFLRRHDDGRYGGHCEGRWDGTRYWGAQEPEVVEQHLALLRPMLAAYPAAPPGFDGWWRF